MKTKFIILFYQNMGVFDQQKGSQALLDTFYKKVLPAQMKVQTSAQKYLTVQQWLIC